MKAHKLSILVSDNNNACNFEEYYCSSTAVRRESCFMYVEVIHLTCG